MRSPGREHSKAGGDRGRAPVFVLGSPRSGTTLLYDMLLSAGGFAVYLAESNVFNLLGPRFGDFGSRANREKILEAWLGSKLFRASGLEAERIRQQILQHCSNAADFLSIVMEEICNRQGASRWAENSPEAMLYLPLIQQLIPDALVLHIIRDGRDVATSLGKLRYVRPLPWEKLYSVVGCGLYWEWMVQHGQDFGRNAGANYMEIRFEELLAHPQENLDRIGAFIHQPLDYGIVQSVGYGSVSRPNTSFQTKDSKAEFNPVGRWKSSFTAEELLLFERLVGNTLTGLGYSLATEAGKQAQDFSVKMTRLLHRGFFEAKFRYKNNAFLRRLRPHMTSAEIDEIVLAEDHPPTLKHSTAICSRVVNDFK